MKLLEIRCRDDQSGERIEEVHIVLADHADPDERDEWLDAQLAVDLPTSANGAVLRAEVLKHLIGRLGMLAQHYERVASTSAKQS